MPEYEMPVDEQLKILVRKFTAFEGSIHERFDKVDVRLEKIDARLDRVDVRLDNIDVRLDNIDGRLDNIDERLDNVDVRLDGVDSRLDKAETRIDRIEIRLDETHAIAKRGLEAVDGLRESIDQKSVAADKKQNQQLELLKTVIVHVRKRVEVVDRPGRRRS
jgi:chromosome segregation ATPase